MAVRVELGRAAALAEARAHAAQHGVSSAALNAWIGDDHERRSALAYTAWGVIVWSQAFGRPRGSLASGFQVRHDAYWEMSVPTPEGSLDRGAWFAQDDVALFDLPAEGEDFRVGFSCPSVVGSLYTGDNRVVVSFATDRDWLEVMHPVHGRTVQPLWIEPTGRSWKATQDRTLLEAFVVRRLFS